MKKALKIIIGIIMSIVLVIGILIVVGIMTFGYRFGIFIIKPSAKGYVKQAVSIMDSGLYADSEAWKTSRKEALDKAKSIDTYEQAHEIISDIIYDVGGKHSRLLLNDANTADAVKEEKEFFLPEVTYTEDEILIVKLPEMMGTKEECETYAKTALDQIKNCPNPKGVIIDLRDNFGGDMGPMVSAISPFLPDGVLMYFHMYGQKMPVILNGTATRGGGTPVQLESFKMVDENRKIAVLVNENTASSAEATMICLMGIKNSKSFGVPTAGYCSANNLYPLADGAKLMLTIGEDVSLAGDTYNEDPISPDVVTDTALEDATAWIFE